ncbi:MAG: hypothetical protein K8S13_03160 [Desulfobacula sp.]|uniref:hypothetical protein n=1 Tax=Desulfobacula sp. TaxID=2593537 RepID=UPI0025C4681F|nr:hypothetical protein [Desulfobacula sp.]MCD4718843.1 hypothetical protein [Desulfobacula sp.]
MEIILDLSRHCIETASKKKYERLIRQYFKTTDTQKENFILEDQISALKYFLEKADFSELRNRCSNSDSVEKKAVLIVSQPFEKMHVRFNKTILYPTWKSE